MISLLHIWQETFVTLMRKFVIQVTNLRILVFQVKILSIEVIHVMLERQEGNEESEATRQRLPGDNTPESQEICHSSNKSQDFYFSSKDY